MRNLSVITPTRIGLRAYDTAIGFRNLDERGAVITDFGPTHTVGMAAILAGAIKGKDVIRDAQSLKRIAAEVLKINPYAFDKVVLELAELEIVRGIQKKAGEIVSFAESVPLLYDDIHERLGTWKFSDDDLISSKLLGDVAKFLVQASGLKASYSDAYLELLEDWRMAPADPEEPDVNLVDSSADNEMQERETSVSEIRSQQLDLSDLGINNSSEL